MQIGAAGMAFGWQRLKVKRHRCWRA